ncbi:glycoside hydrolase family 3 N-terminal domain-containing protein [Aeromicrobium sp. CTD01-1L150]|uniref:glycoside hydrolase family 3 N-terminal domain-containing protein n=1 Tax=Aeromicrobium sp. CTD01-1L150 TaxID=3341830 RepID=UPI0035BF6B3F
MSRWVLLPVVLLLGGALALTWRLQDDPDSTSAQAGQEQQREPEPTLQSWTPTEHQVSQARRIVEDLTLDELAGQLIVARHVSEKDSLRLVRERHVAGVMVTGQRPTDGGDDPLAQVKDLNGELRAAGADRGVPVLLPIDQEGGLVARIEEPMTVFGSFMGAGAAVAGDPQEGAQAVRQAAAGSGAELREAGFTMVLAPVADLSIGPDHPAIGSRSPSSDPEVAARTVLAAVEGYGDAALLSTVKHFPGHNVDEDSHDLLPTLESSEEELGERDLVPFVAAIEQRAPAVMVGHLDVPALDAGTPASLSREVVTGWLRDRLGFEGVIISDALDMGAVTAGRPAEEAVVATLRAGNDLALMPVDADAAHAAVVEALESGRLEEEQARASATRTVSWLLAQDASTALPGGPGSADEAAQEVARAGLSIVTRPCGRPLDVDAVEPVGPPGPVARFRAAAQDVGLTLGGGTRVALIGADGVVHDGDVAVATDTPYPLARSQASVRIALHGSGEPAMRALAEVLAGDAPAGGSLSVEVPGLEPTSC